MKVEGNLGNIVQFQVNRNIINLYKSFLITLEDLEHDHINHFNKLKRQLPADVGILDQADYLDNGKMDHLRKRVLDAGNHCIREIMTTLESCSVIVETKE